MGTIIIKNLSTIRDDFAVLLALQILAEEPEDIICMRADRYNVDVGVRTDEIKNAKTFTITDRD